MIWLDISEKLQPWKGLKIRPHKYILAEISWLKHWQPSVLMEMTIHWKSEEEESSLWRTSFQRQKSTDTSNWIIRRISKPELRAFLHFLGTTFWDALAEVAVCSSSTFPGSKNSSCKNFHIDLINLAPTTPYFKRLVYRIYYAHRYLVGCFNPIWKIFVKLDHLPK